MPGRGRRVVLPNDEWAALGSGRRREVARAARRGRQHPDPHVAAVAQAWATQTLQPVEQKTPVRRRIKTALGIAAVVLIALVVREPIDLGSSDWLERRLARRVLAAR